MLEASSRANVKHFIFTSTSSVYGAGLAAHQMEDGVLIPISPYGVAKLAAEHYARYFFFEKKLPTTSVRIFNVYGPRQNPESKYSLVLPGLLSKILKRERPQIDGTGRQSRDFVYVSDVLDALFKIMGNSRTFGEVYNLGSGRSTPIREIAAVLLKLCGSPMEPMHGPRRPGDPDHTCADISKARRALGWTPQVDLEEGLKRVVVWAKS